MPTSTEVALATTVLSASAAKITFSSISGSYTDLRLVLKGTTDAAGNQFELTFNGVTTGTTYSKTHLYGSAATGTAVSGSSSSDSKILLDQSVQQTSAPFLITVDIFGYAGSTYKTVLATANEANTVASSYVNLATGLWRNTAAITSLRLNAAGGNFTAGTVATIYGIL